MLEFLSAIGSKLPLTEFFRRVLDQVPWLDLERAKEARAHDRVKFEELNATLSERQLERFLTEAFNLSIPRSSYKPVEEVLNRFRAVESEMITSSLEQLRLTFLDRLEELANYLSMHVFPRGTSEHTQFAFLPEINPDYAGIGNSHEKLFFEKRDELYRLIDDCEAAYKAFRRAVKQKLLV